MNGKKKHNPSILDWIVDKVISPIKTAISGVLSPIIGHPTEVERRGLKEAVAKVREMAVSSLAHSPASSPGLSPTDAFNELAKGTASANDYAGLCWLESIAAEIVSAGQVDISIAGYQNLPVTRALFDLATSVMKSQTEIGLWPLLRRYWLKEFQPNIPPAPDLIQMVVREAFLPEMVVTAPKVFSDYMMESGYAPEWSDRYWTAHFVPIDLRQAYENLWRGFWTKEDFMFALHIADIHPRWREDIYNVAFRPPSMREMGYGWDMGVYTEEDIATYRRWGGLSPEDAAKAARAMVAYRLHAEQEALRSLAVRLYREGLDGPEEFEANLEATETPEILRPYWRARADLEAELDIAADYTVILKSAALAGRITREVLARELGQLGLKQWKINQILADVDFRRRISVEAARALTPTQILRAYQAGIRPMAWAQDRLLKLNYSAEDVGVLLALYKPGGEAAG